MTLVDEVMAAGVKIGLPSSVVEAEYMEKIGFAYLREHAPDKLTPEALARPLMAPEPLGYDVIMDLTHRLVAKVRTNNLDEARELNDLMRELERLYPEAATTIAKRWGNRE